MSAHPPTPNAPTPEPADERSERLIALAGLEEWLEKPMQLLGFIWLALLILELTRGLSPLLTTLTTIIWVLFILDFVLRLTLAPSRWLYLRRNWLGALSLVVPALRVLRFARAARVLRMTSATRGMRLVKVVGSLNRGMRSLGRTMGRRGIGYVVTLTVLVTLAGAAGMYAFERDVAAGSGIHDYPTALWWTAMLMTTMGSSYWPVTVEGRVLCLLLSLYAFGIFGYVTAALASFFVGRDAERDDAEIAGRHSIDALRADIAALRESLNQGRAR